MVSWELIPAIITLQYRMYLERFASKKAPSGGEFARVLLGIERMASTVRDVRTTMRLLQKT